jgi:hypothetical protein
MTSMPKFRFKHESASCTTGPALQGCATVHATAVFYDDSSTFFYSVSVIFKISSIIFEISSRATVTESFFRFRQVFLRFRPHATVTQSSSFLL